jgi:N-acetylmuramoyl-L-alanine amidase
MALATVVAAMAVYVSASAAQAPRITIVYPREGQALPPIDSEFVVGQALDAQSLKINGVDTRLYDSGAFLGWIPVRPGPFAIDVVAKNRAGESRLVRNVAIALPAAETPQESLRVETDFVLPSEDVWLWSGDLFEVTCRTSPRSEVFFSLPGVVERVPMTELPAQTQPIFRGNAFRNSPVADSTRLHGVYYGQYRIGPGERADSAPVVIFARNRVALYAHDTVHVPYATDSVRYSTDSLFADLFTTDTLPGRVTILDDRFTSVAQVKDSVVVARVGPQQGYFWPFIPRGTRLEITGRHGSWFRLRAAPYQEIWIHDTSLVRMPAGLPVRRGTVNYTRIDSFDDRSEVRLSLTEQLPYRISESLDPLELTITVYGATSDIDWIRYDFDDVLVQYADWRQPQPGVLEYTVRLNCDQLWGYDSYYDGTTLVVAVNKPPRAGGDGLHGMTIVIDPGHSADDGSVGPTGLKEKVANLWIARKLRESLERRGAQVTMTRDGFEDVPLYERPKIAGRAKADLFVSVHNNALPDGTNPWLKHGVSTYYHYPSSKALAECVQGSLLGSLDMPDFGLFRANFAVVRPTQYPSILVECAFMILPDHEAELKTPAFQERAGEAIAAGIEAFVKQSLPDRKYEEARKERERLVPGGFRNKR